MSKKDQCSCGLAKDSRSSLCQTCYENQYRNKTEKLCKGCVQILPIEEFRKKPDMRRPRSKCKKCEATASRTWRKDNPQEFKRRKKQWKDNNPEKHLRGCRRRAWKRLGLDPDLIEPQYNAHDKNCDCCGEEMEVVYTDHCHSTGHFRGFLCSGCNIGLGQFKDNPTRLHKAIDYLILHSPTSLGSANRTNPA
jgi:hypothetical protein